MSLFIYSSICETYCTLSNAESVTDIFAEKKKNGKSAHKKDEKQRNPLEIYRFPEDFGCGGRTRTCDLRVMSPTSYQLLYAAI